MVCLFAIVMFMLNPSQSLALPALGLQQLLPSYLQTYNQGWWDLPSAGLSNDCKKEWDVLYHLGGNGPWIEKVDGVVEGGIVIPEGCEVDMVHLMSRHAERYPTTNAGNRMLDLINRIKTSEIPLGGSLEFVNDWEYFTNAPGKHFEKLTTSGPYAGVLDAFTSGIKLGTRYRHLWNATEHGPTHLWSCDCDRVYDTARHFSAGFFGLESKNAKVIQISENADRGGDTLTPGDTCPKFRTDQEKGRIYGYNMLYKFRATYLGAIAKRLDLENPGFGFTDDEIYSMQEMCGLEINVRGHSPWCAVFTQDEWGSFEYARDVIHFYRAGPGNPYSRAMGWLWLNATTNLLLEGPQTAGSLYFSFVHDGDLIPMLSAFGLFEDAEDLPIDHVFAERRWKTSQVTPMGGRIVFERLSCPAAPEKQYVRFNVNDGIVALEGCSDGPGSSCALAQFAEYVKKRGEIAGDFRETCGLGPEAATRLTFLRQPGFERKEGE